MIFKERDERITKLTNQVYAPMYSLMLALTVLAVIFKYLFLTQSILDYSLEIIAIILSLGYLFVRRITEGIPVFKNSDECIREIQEQYRTHCFGICFFIYIIGEFILMFVFNKVEITIVYMGIWFIPACIIIVQIVRKGLFIWGSKKVQKKATKSFKKNAIIGSLCFGILMGWKNLFSNGAFNATGILWILGYALGWGIPFYFMMNALIKTSEKHADKELKNVEEESADKI